MNCNQWIFDMDGTLTDSMTAVWENAPLALLRRYGRTPRADLRSTLLSMGMADGAQYLIREYALPLRPEDYFGVMRSVIAELYETVELKPGVRELLARLRAEGARMCICSNTWSDQCKTVLTRLGVDDCFEFYIEAQGPCTRAAQTSFSRPYSASAAPTRTAAPSARIPSTRPAPPTTPAFTSSASPTPPAPPMNPPSAVSATSS